MTREEAIKILEFVPTLRYERDIEHNVHGDLAVALDMAIEALEQPEVVRCKDCKYFANGKDGVACSFFDGLVSCEENDFCSYGERKDGEKE